MTTLQQEFLDIIRDYPDFPKPGIVFKDICPMLRSPALFKRVIRTMAEVAYEMRTEQVIGIESRGFLFAVPLALELGVPFVPARKMGKLPGAVLSQSYSLEYGTDHVELQAEALVSKARTLVVDDVIATGGTAAAIGKLLAQQGCPLAGYAFLIELSFLPGRETLKKVSPGATPAISSLLVL